MQKTPFSPRLVRVERALIQQLLLSSCVPGAILEVGNINEKGKDFDFLESVESRIIF